MTFQILFVDQQTVKHMLLYLELYYHWNSALFLYQHGYFHEYPKNDL